MAPPFIASQKNVLTKEGIVLKTVDDIRNSFKKEFRGDYQNVVNVGKDFKTLVSCDTRVETSQLIEFLKMLVAAEFDKEMIEFYKTHKEQLKENKQQHSEKTITTDEYRFSKLDSMIELFEEIMRFFNRIGYFNQVQVVEGDDDEDGPEEEVKE